MGGGTFSSAPRGLVGRLKALELASSRRIDVTSWRSKAKRDAAVAAALSDVGNMATALVVAGPIEGKAQAAIRAAFRADQ